MKTAGVLGGMGPEATLDFMSRVMANTPAECDQDHLRMLVDHNPTLPNRHAAIAGDIPSVGPLLAEMAAGLQTAGADFIVMPCNTAHAFADDIRAAVTVPFLNLVDISVSAAVNTGARKIGVMAAKGCLAAGLYQQSLTRHGLEPILWADAELQQFMALVYRIKAGARDAGIGQTMEELASKLIAQGATSLIAACTEIPLVYEQQRCEVPLLNSTELLAQHTLLFAQGINHAPVSLPTG